jgi:hypothetical protein
MNDDFHLRAVFGSNRGVSSSIRITHLLQERVSKLDIFRSVARYKFDEIIWKLSKEITCRNIIFTP